MAGRTSGATERALKWLNAQIVSSGAEIEIRLKKAAKKFGVHESTLWRALGKQKSK